VEESKEGDETHEAILEQELRPPWHRIFGARASAGLNTTSSSRPPAHISLLIILVSR